MLSQLSLRWAGEQLHAFVLVSAPIHLETIDRTLVVLVAKQVVEDCGEVLGAQGVMLLEKIHDELVFFSMAPARGLSRGLGLRAGAGMRGSGGGMCCVRSLLSFAVAARRRLPLEVFFAVLYHL